MEKRTDDNKLCECCGRLKFSEISGLKDFQPKKTSHGYEGFEVLVEKANNFIKQQLKNNISVDLCNLQSVLIYKNQGRNCLELGRASH